MALGHEWQMARQWLIDAEALPAWHPATKPGSDLVDFSHALRDGVYLCNLCNRIQPGAVPKIHSRPQRQFLCMQNIHAFVSCCMGRFGMKEDALFEPTDLYDVTDFGAVVRSLSALSKTDAARRARLEPFPRERRDAQEEIYANTSFDDSSRGGGSGGGGDPVYAETETESVYADVDEEYDEEGIYGSVVPQYRKLPVQLAASADVKRQHAVMELLETEKSYVEALHMLVECFQKPLWDKLKPEDREGIFLNIESLLADHHVLLGALEKAHGQKDRDISACLKRQANDLKKYGYYCARLPEAQIRIGQLQKDTTFGKVLEACRVRSKQRFGLKELLCVPMQRTLKYPLLLRELIKHSENHPDKPGLEQALKEVQESAQAVNEEKRVYEMQQTLKQIQHSLLNTPLNFNLYELGDMVQDGELKVKSAEETKLKLRYVFLFQRAMLFCKSKGEHFEFKEKVALVASHQPIDLPNLSKGKFSFSWQLVINGHVSCTLHAKTPEAKDKWMKNMKEIYDKTLHPDVPNRRAGSTSSERGSHADSWGSARGPLPPPPSERPPMRPPSDRAAIAPPELPNMGGSKSPKISRNPTGKRVSFKVNAVQNYRGQPHPGGNYAVLHFDKGDQIHVVHQMDQDWWEGILLKTNQSGYFPAGLVRSSEEIEIEKARSRSRMSYEDAVLHPKAISQSGRSRSPPPLPPAGNQSVSGIESPDSVRRKYAQAPWFVGRLARGDADLKLATAPDGTFLIRESENRPGEFALSIKYKQPKHIKIVYKHGLYQLSDLKQCSTIEQLVEYYKRNTLGISFPGLDSMLKYPFRAVDDSHQYCKAMYAFQARGKEELTLDDNCDVRILSKETHRPGWWYGEYKGKTGLFPFNYVQEY